MVNTGRDIAVCHICDDRSAVKRLQWTPGLLSRVIEDAKSQSSLSELSQDGSRLVKQYDRLQFDDADDIARLCAHFYMLNEMSKTLRKGIQLRQESRTNDWLHLLLFWSIPWFWFRRNPVSSRNSFPSDHEIDVAYLEDLTHLSHHCWHILQSIPWDNISTILTEGQQELTHTLLELADAIASRPWILQINSTSMFLRLSEREQHEFLAKLFRLIIRLGENFNAILPPPYLDVISLSPSPLKCGGFADIYQGRWNNQPVAVKKLRTFLIPNENYRKEAYKILHREATIWRYLRHPNILSFLGFLKGRSQTDFEGIVSPWMENGNIVEYIARTKQTSPFTDQKIDQLLVEIASGLSYLHNVEVVHGDLRGPNILIDDEGHARLADFGLATFSETTSFVVSSRQPGATAWMAPELHDPRAFGLPSARRSRPSDVYSFGCVCWELYTGLAPFPSSTTIFGISSAVVQGERPKRNTSKRQIPDTIWALIERCWAHDYRGRPTVDEVKQILQDRIQG